MANNKKIKVLIAEDEEVLRRMYLTKFKAEGFEAYGANNGEEAIKMAQEIKPDIILLDIIMPLADGFTVLKDVKKEASLKNTPVLMLTNLAQESDVEEGKKLGAVGYLVKTDFTPTQVVEKVRETLKNKI